MRLRILVALLLVPGLAVGDDVLPMPEIKPVDSQVTLPPVPTFELPDPEPGFVDPRYLRVRGRKLLDTNVKVKGYIVWIYNCIDALKTPKQSRKRVQKLIDDDPTLCERPKFYLATTRDTPLEKALWVVDVPRPPNKLEKQRLPKQELAAWPKVPKYKLGDYVLVTGDFKTASPHSERNSDGLIVFSAIEPAKPSRKKPVAATPAAASSSPPAPRAIPQAPPRTAVDRKKVDASMAQLNAGNKAMWLKQFATAIDAYRRALKIDDQNHVAWYGLGGALASTADWSAALEAFEHAAKLRPDSAMYQMWSGIASVEATVGQARVVQAKQQNVKPEDVSVDQSALVYDTARERLELAIAIEPKLWRAHYYLGRIDRAADRMKPAAESFTRSIQSSPTQSAPYIALGELYRKWDYTDQAIAVAELGTKELPQSSEASDVYYVLGMAYDDKRDDKKAVDAFTRAIELNRDNYKAMFQRGQAYFNLKKFAEAKVDLQRFVDSPTTLTFAKEQATKMLADIAARAK
jgi:tetratricopeptide (TPR) repeat protein